MSNPDNWSHKLRVLERLGIEAGNRVLDYGCGAGNTVHSLNEGGYEAYGFDVIDYVDKPSDRIVIGNPDKLPFPDDHFDMVFSDQVFEHAFHQDRVFAELYRVTRPGGVHFHIIPAKWQLIEPHIYVPLGGLIKSRWWYRLWAIAGIRNEFQDGLSNKEIASRNLAFANEGLNYLSTSTYRRMWSRIGFKFRFAEIEYMASSNKPKVRKLSKIPLIDKIIRIFWVRVAILECPKTP
jgi:SAM-dependent methyltransferase